MEFKEILVHLDPTPACRLRIRLATHLARRHGARLIGWYATARRYYAAHRTRVAPLVKETESFFMDEAERAGIVAEWFSGVAEDTLTDVNERLSQRAFYADLVILGQEESRSGEAAGGPVPEQVALGSGRPVLVVPNRGVFETVGDRVMVAWRDGRASGRALHDALPILKAARKVHVVGVQTGEEAPKGGALLQGYLEQHGIEIVIEKLKAEKIGIGDILLNQACDLGVDLVVLGIYPSGRIGPGSPGPVARHLLEHMTTPVLISG